MTNQYKITIRDRDLAIWEAARAEAEREYIPFSRYLIKILEEHLAREQALPERR